MRNLLIFISLLVSFPAFSQRLEWSKIFNQRRSGYLIDFRCKIGCFGIGDYDSLGSINQWAFVDISPNGIQSFLGSGSYFRKLPQVLGFDNSHYYLRSSEWLSNSNWVLQYGRTSVAKFEKGTNRKLWENYTFNSGLGYFGNYKMGAFQENPTCFTYISTRNNYPFTGAAEHPFIQEFDSSGNLLWERDLLNWPNIHSFAGGAYKYPDYGIFISQIQRVAAPFGYEDSIKLFGIWYDKPTRTVFKKKVIPGYIPYSSINDYEITPIKGDKYLVNLNLERTIWVPERIQTYLTDSSLDLPNAFWVKNNYQIDQAIALEDGHLLTIKVIDLNARIRLQKLNVLNGDTIWSRIISVPNFPSFRNYRSKPKCSIDDSGNLYCYLPDEGIGDGIWVFKVSNVGQQWDPWNPNPNGTGEARKKFTFYPFPNPTTGKLRLRGLNETEGVSLRLFNNQGQEVWKGSPSIEGEIDISSLPVGLYHLEALNAQGQRWSSRVVRE